MSNQSLKGLGVEMIKKVAKKLKCNWLQIIAEQDLSEAIGLMATMKDCDVVMGEFSPLDGIWSGTDFLQKALEIATKTSDFLTIINYAIHLHNTSSTTREQEHYQEFTDKALDRAFESVKSPNDCKYMHDFFSESNDREIKLRILKMTAEFV